MTGLFVAVTVVVSIASLVLGVGLVLQRKSDLARRARAVRPTLSWARVLAIERRRAATQLREGSGHVAAPFVLYTDHEPRSKGERSMAGEVARWLANGALERDVAAVRRRGELAEAQVMAIGQVTRDAMQ